MITAQQTSSLFRNLEFLCVSLIGLNLLWPLWYESSLSATFSIACFILFALMAIEGFNRVRVNVPAAVVVGYLAFLLWILIMLVVYEEFYSVGSRAQFFFLNLDSSAMFFVMLFLFCIPTMLLSDIHKIKMNNVVLALILVVLITTTYYTSKAINFDANAIRSSRSMIYEGYGYILYGTPGYSHIYSFMLLVPFFLHKSLTVKGKSKIVYIASLVMMAYMITVSQLATALILTVLGILVYTFFHAKSVAKVLVAVVGVFLAFLIIDNNGYDMLMALSGKVEGDWSVKFVDLAKSLVGEQDSGMVSGRKELYAASFESFLKSPFVGKFIQNDGSIGGHATAIDVLGLTGVLGFIPFIIVIVCNGQRMKYGSDYNDLKPVIIATVIQFLVLVFTKNIITAQPIFFTYFVLVPMLVKSEETEKIKE